MSSKALVILPFESAEKAEEFARLVTVQMPNVGVPFVMHGTAYEYRNTETAEEGQVFEIYPPSNFDVFVGDQGEGHHVLQRITKEGSDEGTG